MVSRSSKEREWNLTPLFSGDADKGMSKERDQRTEAFKAFAAKWRKQNTYLEDTKELKIALDEYEKLIRTYGNTSGAEGYYWWLRSSQNQEDPTIRAAYNLVSNASKQLSTELAFFTIDLSKIPIKKQKEFLSSSLLKEYHHFLDQLFKSARYTLSEAEEKIITFKSKTSSSNWEDMVSTLLSKEEREIIDESGKKVKKNLSEIANLLKSSNKKVRDSAAVAFNDMLARWKDVAEHEINSLLEDHQNEDQLRGFSRPDSYRHISDDIETEVVDALLKAVEARFDISRRYYALKAKLLDVPVLKYHERSVPYGKAEKTFSYEQSIALCDTVFKRLDSEFSEIFNRFVSNGQMDVYPKRGKQSGAFCVRWSLSTPTYILLNHTNKLRDVTTIAHECGHGINNELIRKKHHALYFDTPLATAEVASTFMEDFVIEEIMRTASDEERLSLLVERLDDAVSSIFRQVACYRFEQELHATFRKEGYLSLETIGKLFQKHMSAYMGSAVEQSPGSENWWVYWSHIRRFFYVYSYASGLLISKALQHKVRERPTFIHEVKEFLSAGTSDSPKSVFKRLGIDITSEKFWNDGLDEIDSLLGETEKLAVKLGKISVGKRKR